MKFIEYKTLLCSISKMPVTDWHFESDSLLRISKYFRRNRRNFYEKDLTNVGWTMLLVPYPNLVVKRNIER
jgi:hypothetical protein